MSIEHCNCGPCQIHRIADAERAEGIAFRAYLRTLCGTKRPGEGAAEYAAHQAAKAATRAAKAVWQ